MYIVYWGMIRFILPILAILILGLNVKTILHKLKRKTLARFAVESYNDIVEIKSAECIIGRSVFCDVRLKTPLRQNNTPSSPLRNTALSLPLPQLKIRSTLTAISLNRRLFCNRVTKSA